MTAQGVVRESHRPRDGLFPFSILPTHRGPRSVIHARVRNPCCLIDGEVLFDSVREMNDTCGSTVDDRARRPKRQPGHRSVREGPLALLGQAR